MKIEDSESNKAQTDRQSEEGKRKEGNGGKYLYKDKGSTTPLWAKTHVQKDMATLYDTPISLTVSGLQRHEQSHHS